MAACLLVLVADAAGAGSAYALLLAAAIRLTPRPQRA
jgi:hypothetical protein